MTFEVRCKTPFGPFSSPELLDLKAPAAVHTAQGRISAWNREHINVAEHNVETRQPIRGKVGPAQYEVHYSSYLCELFCADSCKFHTWLQALLQEILISTGCAEIPAHQPSHKRLACHVTLLKQLLQAGVFGPLQVKAEQQLHQSVTIAESMRACSRLCSSR